VTLGTPLSDAEIGELDAFLMSEATSDECMDLVAANRANLRECAGSEY
jgi:hypothetical protein